MLFLHYWAWSCQRKSSFMMHWRPFRRILLSMTCSDMVSSFLLVFLLPNLGQEWRLEETMIQVYVCWMLVSWSQSHFFFLFRVCKVIIPSAQGMDRWEREKVCMEGKGKSSRMSLRQREEDEVSEKGRRCEESECGSSLSQSVRVFRPSASIHFSDENTTSQDCDF